MTAIVRSGGDFRLRSCPTSHLEKAKSELSPPMTVNVPKTISMMISIL